MLGADEREKYQHVVKVDYRRVTSVSVTDPRRGARISPIQAPSHTLAYSLSMPTQWNTSQESSAGLGDVPLELRRDGYVLTTDLATFAYLCDVVVDPAHGRRGLAQWMVRTILEHPQVQGVRRFSLMTRDARALYEKLGFTDKPTSTYMELRPT